jgi:RNA polymerase sigma factor for flagellar operon FliA
VALSEEERELWIRYRRDGDAEARDFLFETHAPWARQVAGRVYSRLRVPQMEWADFVQNASIGLLEAMSRFDPARGLDFIAYAKLRVQGAAFNGVRVFLTGVDRGMRPERFGERLDLLSEREGEAGDPLTDLIDIVAGLGVGFLLESTAPTRAEDLQTQIEQTQLGHLLTAAMQSLSEKERVVLVAHYLNHVPFIDVARDLGLTKGRISQLHKSGLLKLRATLAERRFDQDAWL